MNAAIVLCILGWGAVLKSSIYTDTTSTLTQVQGDEVQQATAFVTVSEQALESKTISLPATRGTDLVTASFNNSTMKKRKSKRIISALSTKPKQVIPEDMRKYLPKKFRHKQCFFSDTDRQAEICSFCHHFNMRTVSIYLENFNRVNLMTSGQFSRYETEAPSCKLPNGAKCLIQHDDPKGDAVMKEAAVLGTGAWPMRYCYPQVIILSNAAGRYNVFGYDLYADITVDQSLSSTILYGNTCPLMAQLLEKRNLEPSDHRLRMGAVMFIDHCSKSFIHRNEWLKSFLKVINVDSYGKCMRNRPAPSVTDGNWKHNIAVNYRFVIIHEPIFKPGHISARIFNAFLAGAIPVYRGPRDIYDRIPGNHTIIFADDFSTPLELSQYLMKIEAHSALFHYHTKLNFTIVEQFVNEHCKDWNTSVACKLCNNVYSHKLATYLGGGRPCNCKNQPLRVNEYLK